MSENNPSETNTLLKTILDQVAKRPTTSTLAELAIVLETDLDTAIEASSQTIQNRLEDIIEGANQLPQLLSSRLKSRVDEIIQTMSNTNQLILSEISKHKKTVELLHTSQQKMSSSLIQEIFDMKMMIRRQNDRFDTAMAKIQEQQQQSESFLVQQRNDISANQSQMQELLTSVQHLADTMNDDNKGENQGRGRGMVSRGRSTEDRGDRGRSTTARGRGGSGHRGRSSFELSRSSSRPPPMIYSQAQASSSRPSSSSRPVAANVEEELQRFHNEIRVKEEQAILREEEALRKEEEDRREFIRNQQRKDSSSSSRRR